MKILGIETSCDETAVAVVEGDAPVGERILAHQLVSQIEEHAEYGGVVPEIASRAHLDVLDVLIKRAMEEAGCGWSDLDAIAATTGPGLIGGVIVGVMEAKAIASATAKPFIAVNHLEGHALTVRLTDDVAFPYLLLLVSGGHCQWLLVQGVGRYQLLGQTIDDAVGEAFDKVAKMLGLGYPGGPKVEAMARLGRAAAYDFPRPLCQHKHADMSFSGLKTAVRQVILQEAGEAKQLSDAVKADICASFQQAVADVLVNRLRYAVEKARVTESQLNQLVIAGGVAANRMLYGALSEAASAYGFSLIAPPLSLCTDNAAMIGWAGVERFRLGLTDPLTTAPRARWGLV